MDWFLKFPHLNDESLLALKRGIDDGFRSFTRAYGDVIESFFAPLKYFLIHSENFLTQTPWPIITGLILTVAWFASRSIKVTASALLILLARHRVCALTAHMR